MENEAFLKRFDCLDGGWHVFPFGDCDDSVFDEFLRVRTVEFILVRANCAFRARAMKASSSFSSAFVIFLLL
jgi:hypothetical protein